MKLVSILLAGCALAAADADTIRTAAQKSMALIQKSGSEWKTKCVSCHHQSIPQMSYEVFRKHGVALDGAAMAAQLNTSLGYLSDLDMIVQWTLAIDPAFTDAMHLNGLAAQNVPATTATDITAWRLAKLQRADGHWPTFDGRPPMSYSLTTATAVTAKAVNSYYPAGRETEKSRVIRNAAKWLAANAPSSTEDASYQVLGLVWTSAPKADRSRAAAALAQRQNADGGWGQLPGLASDAYSTGEALWALAENDPSAAAAASWKKGLDYLLSTQLPDGSWHVKSRYHKNMAQLSPPYFESGFPHGADQYISIAGTNYAALALAKALPPAASPAAPVPVAAIAIRDEPSWLRTAFFGSAPELAKALKAGLDPNAATSGGTSVLMVAAHDPAKVELLLKAGATASATAKSGTDALMTASMYPGSSSSVQRLLAAGASAKPREGIRFAMTPVMLAAYAGDVATIKALADAGAAVEQTSNLVGQVPSTPMEVAACFNEPAVVNALVKAGADINRADARQGTTVLELIALRHRTSIVPTLKSLGADLNHKNQKGYTALELAGVFDYPPPALLQELQPKQK